MADERLISDRLLRSDSFRQDLKLLLQLNETGLDLLARLGDNPSGFESVSPKTLSREVSIDEEKTTRIIRVAEYLYLEMLRRGIEISSVIEELVAIANSSGIDLS